jgi:hypothetical protein
MEGLTTRNEHYSRQFKDDLYEVHYACAGRTGYDIEIRTLLDDTTNCNNEY